MEDTFDVDQLVRKRGRPKGSFSKGKSELDDHIRAFEKLLLKQKIHKYVDDYLRSKANPTPIRVASPPPIVTQASPKVHSQEPTEDTTTSVTPYANFEKKPLDMDRASRFKSNILHC